MGTTVPDNIPPTSLPGGQAPPMSEPTPITSLNGINGIGPDPSMLDVLSKVKFYSVYKITEPVVDAVDQDTAVVTSSLGFDYSAVQVVHSVANGPSPLRRFFGVVLR